MPHVIAAGALVRGNRVLLGHRSAGRRDFPDCWALPGGHVEQDGRAADALVRELAEELGIEAIVTGTAALHLEREPHLEQGMLQDVWVVTTWAGEPANLAPDEHDELRWAAAEDLPHLELAHPEYLPFLVALLTGRR